jgi:hypothetical protein
MSSLSQSRINHYNLLNTVPIHRSINATKPDVDSPIHNKLLLETSTAVYADTSPAPTRDPVRGGWNYTKDIAGVSKFNYYFYGNQTANPMKLNELLGMYMIGTIHTFIDTVTVPFFVIYTLPTGVGDAAAWYKSRISYSINLEGKKLYSGEKILLYTGLKPDYVTKLRSFKLEYQVTTGTADPQETVDLLSLHCASEVGVNHSVTVQNIGWSNSDVGFNIELK